MQSIDVQRVQVIVATPAELFTPSPEAMKVQSETVNVGALTEVDDPAPAFIKGAAADRHAAGRPLQDHARTARRRLVDRAAAHRVPAPGVRCDGCPARARRAHVLKDAALDRVPVPAVEIDAGQRPLKAQDRRRAARARQGQRVAVALFDRDHAGSRPANVDIHNVANRVDVVGVRRRVDRRDIGDDRQLLAPVPPGPAGAAGRIGHLVNVRPPAGLAPAGAILMCLAGVSTGCWPASFWMVR